MNIVVLDGAVVNPGDLSWGQISEHGSLKVYDHTSDDELIARAKEAEILLTNKRVINRSTMKQLPKLKLICLLATGYNNVDVAAAKELGITVCNAVGYGSMAVAQHVFALILSATNFVVDHSTGVHKGTWTEKNVWSYWKSPLIELADKKIGIYGFGKIGNKVADIAMSFGMKVLSTHKHPTRDARQGVRFVDINTLCKESDFITLHAPLTSSNQGLINKELLSFMKPSAFLVNTGRGGLVNESDLKTALENNVIRGAGIDVLSSEPPPSSHPLIGVKNCIITPHNAWAAKNARQRLIEIVGENIASFLKGKPINIVT